MSDKQRIARVQELAAQVFERIDHFEVMRLIRASIKPLIDEGTSIDSGGGPDSADLWFRIAGIEYYANIRRSNAQIEKGTCSREP